MPSDVDLRDFPFMPLDVQRLRSSDLAAMEKPEACWAAVLLWCASWHQVPAASLPEDDRVLANLAGYGRDLKRWERVRRGALRGFVEASDGRWYHPTVAEKALEAWLEKLAQRLSGGEGNAKRWGVAFDRAPLDQAIAEARRRLVELNPQSRALAKRATVVGRPSHPESPPDSAKDRKGQGQGQGEGYRKPKDEVGLTPDVPGVERRNGHDELRMRELRAEAEEILAFLNKKAGKNYQPVKANIDLIVARLREGGTADDMRGIIAKKCREWRGRDGMEEYLRPGTLFGAKNFWQKYQGELAPAGGTQ